MALLDHFNFLARDFDITESELPPKEFRLEFVMAQHDEIKKILWREVVDFIIASQLSESDDEVVRIAAQTKISEKRTNIRQFTKALKNYEALVSELKD